MILNINKPLNWTSNDVVRKTKSLLNIKKVGHAGTLDPLATGVLIILTDLDTKKQEDFMQMPKEYVFEMALGVVSATYDMEGPLSLTEGFTALSDETVTQIINKETLSNAFAKYVGKFMQKVPAYSAAKYKGKALYKYARAKGDMPTEIPIKQKEVEIYKIEILDFIPKKEIPIMGKTHLLPHVKVKVFCGKGTYIRSLAHDVGQDLRVGAVVTELIRTKVGTYSIDEAESLADLTKNANAPAESLPCQPK